MAGSSGEQPWNSIEPKTYSMSCKYSHRSITNTLKYTQLINFKGDEYTTKVAHSEQELCQLLEAGYEYICDYNENKILRKRK
jgi:hypothetical protein